MATALLARTIRAVINAHRGLDRRANVLHFQVTGTDVTAADVDAVAADMNTFVTTNYKPLISAQVIFDDITVTDASRENGYQKVVSLGSSAGGYTGAALPGNACMVVTLHTAQAGRQGRGRVFCMDMAQNNINDNETWKTDIITAMQSAWQNLADADSEATGYQFAVGSRVGLCSFPVTSVVTHDYVGNQKDRLPGHRRHKRTPAP